jgi:hypothetical protein
MPLILFALLAITSFLLRASATALLLVAVSNGCPSFTATSISEANTRSFLATKFVTFPVAPARAVRPLRWM